MHLKTSPPLATKYLHWNTPSPELRTTFMKTKLIDGLLKLYLVKNECFYRGLLHLIKKAKFSTMRIKHYTVVQIGHFQFSDQLQIFKFFL